MGKSKWIPVSERLPEEHLEDGILHNFETVLVSCENGNVTEAWWRGVTKDFVRQCSYCPKVFRFETNPITHWMPLPEPPKE